LKSGAKLDLGFSFVDEAKLHLVPKEAWLENFKEPSFS